MQHDERLRCPISFPIFNEDNFMLPINLKRLTSIAPVYEAQDTKCKWRPTIKFGTAVRLHTLLERFTVTKHVTVTSNQTLHPITYRRTADTVLHCPYRPVLW